MLALDQLLDELLRLRKPRRWIGLRLLAARVAWICLVERLRQLVALPLLRSIRSVRSLCAQDHALELLGVDEFLGGLLHGAPVLHLRGCLVSLNV